MLKLFDERAFAVAKQQDIPLLQELIPALLSIDAGWSGKPFDRESRPLGDSLNMGPI
jgi:hypothetical protein